MLEHMHGNIKNKKIVHTYMHGDMHENIHTYMYIYIYTCIHAYMYKCTHICSLTYMHIKRKLVMLPSVVQYMEIILVSYRDYMPLKYTYV